MLDLLCLAFQYPHLPLFNNAQAGVQLLFDVCTLAPILPGEDDERHALGGGVMHRLLPTAGPNVDG